MPFIKIENYLKTNVKILDDEHNDIAKSINRLYELVKIGSIEEQIKEMENFSKLVNDHFDNEDRLMTEHKDPGYISHKLEHNRMRSKTTKVLDDLKRSKEPLTPDYVAGLKQWFENHLDFKDIKLGKHLNSVGIY